MRHLNEIHMTIEALVSSLTWSFTSIQKIQKRRLGDTSKSTSQLWKDVVETRDDATKTCPSTRCSKQSRRLLEITEGQHPTSSQQAASLDAPDLSSHQLSSCHGLLSPADQPCAKGTCDAHDRWLCLLPVFLWQCCPYGHACRRLSPVVTSQRRLHEQINKHTRTDTETKGAHTCFFVHTHRHANTHLHTHTCTQWPFLEHTCIVTRALRVFWEHSAVHHGGLLSGVNMYAKIGWKRARQTSAKETPRRWWWWLHLLL